MGLIDSKKYYILKALYDVPRMDLTELHKATRPHTGQTRRALRGMLQYLMKSRDIKKPRTATTYSITLQGKKYIESTEGAQPDFKKGLLVFPEWQWLCTHPTPRHHINTLVQGATQ